MLNIRISLLRNYGGFMMDFLMVGLILSKNGVEVSVGGM